MYAQTHGNINVYKLMVIYMCVQTLANMNVCTNTC